MNLHLKLNNQLSSSRDFADMAKLFVYGTLMYPEILEVLLQRVPESARARVQGYKRYGLKKFVFPAVVEDPSSQV